MSTEGKSNEVTDIQLTEEQAAELGGGSTMQVASRDRQEVQMADTVPQRAGILATARGIRGEPAYTLTDDTVVTYHGVPMRLSAAVREGLVRKVAEGQYEDTTQGRETREDLQKAAEQSRQESQAEFPDGAVSSESQKFLGSLHDGLSRAGISPNATAVNFISDPEGFLERGLPDLARAMGVSAEEARAGLISTAAEMYGKYEALASAEGVDVDAFDVYCERHAHVAQAAILESLNGNAAPLRRLMGQFKASNPTPAKVPEGTNVGKTHDGKEYVYVTLPSGQRMAVSTAVALRMGLLK